MRNHEPPRQARSSTPASTSAGLATVFALLLAGFGLAACDGSSSTPMPASNQAPEATGSLADLTMNAGEQAAVQLSGAFRDPDGGGLSYSVVSSDTQTATVALAGTTVTVTAVAGGAATITVRAVDGAGASATQTFAVTVQEENQAPTATGELADLTMTVGDEQTLDVSGSFTDANGNALTFAATSSDGEVAAVSVAGGSLTIMALAAGNTTITVTATDPDGESASLMFAVTVEAPAPAEAVEPSLSFEANKTFRFSWAPAANTTHYKLLENPDGASGFAQVGEDIPAAEGAGEDPVQVDHVVPLFARTQARYVVQSCAASGCQDSAPLSVATRLEGMVSSVGYFKASQPDSYDLFGFTMSLSGDGSTLAVGAIQEDSAATGIDGDAADDTAEDSGAVYIFVRQADASWRQQAYIKASNTDAGDMFGIPALSADGNTLAVGAPAEASGGDSSDNSVESAGAVYVYVRNADGVWTQQAYLKSAAPGEGERFGQSVSLSADGNRLAVGVPLSGAGAVQVFQRDASAWQHHSAATAAGGEPGDVLGVSVALSADGATLAAGAPFEDGGAAGVDGDAADNSAEDAGAIYVFSLSGSEWQQQAYLKADNPDADDNFGIRLALSGNGLALAVGVDEEDSSATGFNGDGTDNSADEAGAAYVFVRSGGGWMQDAYIKASNAAAGDEFGAAVALNQDGSILAVGSESESGSGTGLAGDPEDNSAFKAGAAYVFRRGSDGWRQQAYVKASNTDDDEDDFGTSLGLSADGAVLAVGAYGEDSAASGVNGDQSDKSLEWAGAVYLY